MLNFECIEELLNLHRGQGLDLFWRDSLTCPTEEEYVHMVLGSELVSLDTEPPKDCQLTEGRDWRVVSYRRQTHDGSLIISSVNIHHSLLLSTSCCSAVPTLHSPTLPLDEPLNPPFSDYVPLVNLISVFFQIRDDYMNLQSTEVCHSSHG